MTNSRFAFIRGIAVLVVIALAIGSPLLSPPTKTDVRADLMSPPQPRYVATFHWPRPEIRIERMLKIDESNGLDLDMVSLLKRERERQQETKNQTGAIYQLKSVVATKADSDLAFMAARGVPGLFEVTNELKAEDQMPR